MEAVLVLPFTPQCSRGRNAVAVASAFQGAS